ncbi:MAG: molecular chaperone HtpG [Bacteroidetes bacterium GWF2_41_61]|nr:MAG: molecular chaperone HtpG [Bacteroidetes bacterium GWE2_40_15]OFY32863.1 MAG: molecular chaperone HtpG [Bacteroidetes bacterium GWF2_41_61]OFY89651.1 MAG: molecular chaperone HtpG [Bacteroidetes bacterium RIFOXYA12_FULL_40_10]HBG24129.1 molecular chaperone HtpG [Rikenellaceae bacterium]HBZ26392.1 molecular chaperone HtpG [Rikenellaceae bacterium]
MHKGTIGVTTENIFPIIKKFLYSDHEIFLRELVSNSVDAIQKVKALSSSGEFKDELGDLRIKISSDEKKSTITVSDNGIGMTEEEVQKYINQIAFSSAGEFLDKYKDQLNNIIGHFGLGFYSSFMVAKKVEIQTLSWREGAEPVKWSCEGTPEYQITKGKRKERGTDIILYLDDDSKEYAQESKINYLLNKYCRFLPIEIAFGKEKEWKEGKEIELDRDKIINDTTPLWTKKPSDLKESDYMEFYRKLYPAQEDPLFYIHLNVDYPFTLTGILYFPKIKDKVEVSRNKIQLYCNQVYVTDSVESIVPDFLTLLHGVIDSPDIPLNVSRSYLQSDANVKKISNHITKKVADRLEDLFKNEREKLEEKWDNLKLFIEYGMLSDEKFSERAEKFALLKSSDEKFFSYDEYRKLIEPNQTDKNKRLVYLYSTSKQDQYSYIESAKSRGYDVLLFDSQLDAHFVNHLESKFKESTFARVDSDHIDKLVLKEDRSLPDISADEMSDITNAFEAVLPSGPHYSLTVENMGENDGAVLITQSEFMRRYREMSALGGGMNFYGSLPESYNISINNNHPIIAKIFEDKREKLNESINELSKKIEEPKSRLDEIKAKIGSKKTDEIDTADKDEKERLEEELRNINEQRKALLTKYGKESELIKQVCDLALLSNGMLKGEELSSFIKRSLSLIR